MAFPRSRMVIRRWPGNQRPSDESQQRTLHKSGSRFELYFGGDRQHPLLFCRPGPLRCRRRSITSPSPAPTSFTAISTNSGTAPFQCRRLLHQFHPRKSQAAFHGQPFWRQSRWAASSRQTVLLLRFRMGPHRSSDCYRRHRSYPRVSELCLAATPSRRNRFGHRQCLPPRLNRCRSTRRCSRFMETPAVRPLRSWLSLRFKGSSPAIANDGDGCANRQSVSHSSDDHEQVQTARIDYNLDERNTLWFRFQADTGVQAAYTDPINPIFDAVSPQPLYSFAAGYTHVFSQNLVNYFNPGILLVRKPLRSRKSPANSLGFPDRPRRHRRKRAVYDHRRSRQYLDSGSPRISLLCERQPRLEPWRTRIPLRYEHSNFPPNDYDFGRRSVPTVTYTTLPQFIYGVASTASQTFPTSANEPFNFLNLDLYAQDTWKLTKKLTWTIGLRDTLNSNPLNPHYQTARLSGAFDSISHDLNAPLNTRFKRRSAIFSPRPRLRFSSRAPLSHGNSTPTPFFAQASDFSAIFSRAPSPILSDTIRPTSRHFKGVCWAPWAVPP